METQKPEEKSKEESSIQNSNVEIKTDVEVNPFLTEEERAAILAGEIQDPEWD